MNTNKTLMALLLTAALVPSLRADLVDDFDSYANDAAFSAVWTPTVGAGLSLNSQECVSAPYSVKNPGTGAQSNRRQIDPIPAHALDFSFNFYDYNGGAGRDFASLYARGGGGAWTDPFENQLAIGKYDAIDVIKYAGRLAVPGDAIYGGGAYGNAGGWFALGGAPNRLIGWHAARITGGWDPVHPGMVTYNFYIDGVLGASLANCTDENYNWIVLGSGVTTMPGPIAFDNLSALIVPEPSSAWLGTLAALAIARRWQNRKPTSLLP